VGISKLTQHYRPVVLRDTRQFTCQLSPYHPSTWVASTRTYIPRVVSYVSFRIPSLGHGILYFPCCCRLVLLLCVHTLEQCVVFSMASLFFCFPTTRVSVPSCYISVVQLALGSVLAIPIMQPCRLTANSRSLSGVRPFILRNEPSAR
jgi:hypothetical protein